MVLTYAGLLDYNNSDSEASASQALMLRRLVTCALKSWPPSRFRDKKLAITNAVLGKKVGLKKRIHALIGHQFFVIHFNHTKSVQTSPAAARSR